MDDEEEYRDFSSQHYIFDQVESLKSKILRGHSTLSPRLTLDLQKRDSTMTEDSVFGRRSSIFSRFSDNSSEL